MKIVSHFSPLPCPPQSLADPPRFLADARPFYGGCVAKTAVLGPPRENSVRHFLASKALRETPYDRTRQPLLPEKMAKSLFPERIADFSTRLRMFLLNRKGSGIVLNGNAEGSRDLEKSFAGEKSASARGKGFGEIL